MGSGSKGTRLQDEQQQLGSLQRMEVASNSTEESVERGQWSSQLDFILSGLGYAVGIGNVWRFPYLAYKNGGGAFLIPYCLALFVALLPLFFLELCLGQYAGLGPIAIFQHLAPLFSGLGVGMIIISAILCIWYNMLLAWALFYLFSSFTSQLPWQSCDNYWNTHNCYPFLLASACRSEGGVFYNETCYNSTAAELYNIRPENVSRDENSTRTTPTEEFFNRRVLNRTDGIHELGGQQWELVLCLLLAWAVVFFCLCKGIKSSGKVVYFTATFPYIVLTILLVRGVTLEGSAEGIAFYIIPDWKKLQDIEVWKDATIQIFYSLGPAWGGLMTLASYNKFNNNCFRDAWIVAIGNCGTSIFAGFAIFSIIGFMAHDLGVDIKDVAESGPGLAFVAYPEALSRLPVAPFWSISFFVMLITLGLDSQFVTMETVITAIVDSIPRLLKYKTWVTLVICVVWFLLGLTMTSQGGVFVLELINQYAAGWSLMLIAIIEACVVVYLYGRKNLIDNIESMLGRLPLKYYWLSSWLVGIPVCVGLILCWSMYSIVPATYGPYVYPDWAQGVGWCLALLSIIPLPLGALWAIHKNDWKLTMALLRPTGEWGPASDRHKQNMMPLPTDPESTI